MTSKPNYVTVNKKYLIIKMSLLIKKNIFHVKNVFKQIFLLITEHVRLTTVFYIFKRKIVEDLFFLFIKCNI